MIWMYLKEDYVGSYSRNLYALKGDKVAILNNKNPCLLLHENGVKFHADFNLLSYEKIEKENVKIKETKKKKRV